MTDQQQNNPYEYPCPVCQGEKFTWGTLVGGESFTPGVFSGAAGFRPDNLKLSDLVTVYGIRIRQCNRCANLQLFSTTSSAE